jgi:hypothetical protein
VTQQPDNPQRDMRQEIERSIMGTLAEFDEARREAQRALQQYEQQLSEMPKLQQIRNRAAITVKYNELAEAVMVATAQVKAAQKVVDAAYQVIDKHTALDLSQQPAQQPKLNFEREQRPQRHRQPAEIKQAEVISISRGIRM